MQAAATAAVRPRDECPAPALRRACAVHLFPCLFQVWYRSLMPHRPPFRRFPAPHPPPSPPLQDDDSKSLRDLVSETRHGDVADVDRAMARNIAKAGKFKTTDLDADEECADAEQTDTLRTACEGDAQGDRCVTC